MHYELARLTSANTNPEPVGYVVKTPLEDLKKVMTSLASHFGGGGKKSSELGLVNPVKTSQLLLFAETDPIFTYLGPPALPVLSRFDISLVYGAFFRVAPVTLQEKLGPFSPAKTAHSTCISAHYMSYPP